MTHLVPSIFGKSSKQALFFIGTTVYAGIVGLIIVYWRNRPKTLKPSDIVVVTTEKECNVAVEEIKKRSRSEGAVGFDCEWVTGQDGSNKGHRSPVSLVQVASRDGYCVLFRLNILKQVPDTLKNFLEDDTTYKLGVGPIDDAKYLTLDYSIMVKGILDIRHVARNSGYEPGGLDALARQHLSINLDKHWKVRASNWNAQELTKRQILYAANDALVAIRIFEKLLQPQGSFFSFFKRDGNVWDKLSVTCRRYMDLPFTAKQKNVNNDASQPKKRLKEKKYSASARSKPLYQNCFMMAPDGDLLCTCDRKKAQWYVDKGLADCTNPDPFTVKLRFEPAGRAVGEVGRYYQLEKQNKCVVCGMDNSYIRKNVVPREYRKYFPEVMKDHSSHDVVLLCLGCHQRSNMSDREVRQRLALECDAPIAHARNLNRDKYIEDAEAKAVKSAARALLHDWDRHNLPTERRQQLELVINKYYPGQDVTKELLTQCTNVQVLYENDNYESHGKKVVERYTCEPGGLLRLERMWREHFLETMRPQYLPELWCTNHNEERLKIRLNEGRIDPEDVKLIGLDTN